MSDSNTNDSLRAPPQSLEAEQSVLGAVMIEGARGAPHNAAWEVVGSLSERAFFRVEHRIIFEAMRELAEANTPIDILTLADRLEAGPHPGRVGIAYLAELAEETPSAVNVEAYRAIVAERYGRRQRIADGAALQEAACSGDPEGLAEVQARIAEGDYGDAAGDCLTSATDLLAMEFDEEWIVADLIQRGEVTIIGAPPKAGKSTLARQLAAAIAHDKPAYWLGRRIEISGRVLYAALDEPPRAVKRHAETLAKVYDTANLRFLLRDDFAGWDQLEAAARRVRPTAVFVDTLFKALGAVEDESAYAPMVQHMDRLTRLAGRIDAAVIAVHHNRKSGGGETGGGALLGSTAIAGGPDTLITIQREGNGEDDVGRGYRWIASEGRSGRNLERSLLKLGDDGMVALGGKRSDEQIRRARAEVLEAVEGSPGISHQEVLTAVNCRHADAVKALKALAEDGAIRTEGRGVRNAPKLYYPAA